MSRPHAMQGFAPISPDTAGMPLYRAVSRALLQSVEAGAFGPGAVLPSEPDLATAFGVSVGTLRRAVDGLVADHILVRRQGRGTFVATHTRDRFLFHFFHVERGDGLREAPDVELVSFARGRMEEEAAAALGAHEGEASFEIENRLRLQGEVVVYDRITIPARLFRGLTEKRFRERPSTIYHLYQSEFAITVVRAHERVRAVPADRDCARVLGVPLRAPVLQVRRTAIALGGHPVEHRVSSVLTTRHDYVHLLTRTE